MDFSTLLNRFIDELGCSAKDLAEASGLSPAAISRYRTGERTPDPDSRQIRMLAYGIASLSDGGLDEQAVNDSLIASISGISVDYDTYLGNLTLLVKSLSVNNNELARALSFDPSYISRILAGQRRPADLQAFTAGVADFAARRAQQSGQSDKLKETIGPSWPNGSVEENAHAVAVWLKTNCTPTHNPIDGFIEKLDSFDLDDFIRTMHFDELKVPTAPLQLPTTKTHTGIREMMECEIAFLKAAVLSKSTADIILYSDMPMQEMAADDEFPKKWMYGMAMLLKKGLRLHMIHDTNRPLTEMMLGLESWIPMYMTGQISPYYFEGGHDGVFSHIIRSAGTVAMQGEAIVGHQGEGRYILTKSRDEVRYYRLRAERMLERARPLMRIITAADAAKLEEFRDEASRMSVARRIIMSTPPIGSTPPDLLERILHRADMPESVRAAIRSLAERRSRQLQATLEAGEVRMELPKMNRDEFEAHPPALDLCDLFLEESISYTYEEYAEHLEALERLAAENENCTLCFDAALPFRNVQIDICEGRNVLVSKNKGPVIHFIIEHPAMVVAFERFEAPIGE